MLARASRTHGNPAMNASNIMRGGTNLDQIKTPLLNEKKKLSFAMMTPDMHAKSSNLN